jgi:transcriptional regulator with XRE-family HTH domain
VGPHVQYPHMATTGLSLKVQRVGADVRLKDLATAMGVTDSRISRIEASRTVTPEAEVRYLQALRTCITKSTSGEAA